MSNSLMVSGAFGEIQVVSRGGSVLVNVQSRSFDVEGCWRCDHAFAGLSVPDAVRLRELLNEAIVTAAANTDPRQTTLWPWRSP